MAYHVAKVLLIKGRCRLVQMRFWSEIAYTEINSPVLESVAENRDQTVAVAGVVECAAELLDRVTLAGVLKASLFSRLRRLDKIDQRVNIQAHSRIVCIGGLGVATLFGEEERLYVLFKPPFGCYINRHLQLLLSLAYYYFTH